MKPATSATASKQSATTRVNALLPAEKQARRRHATLLRIQAVLLPLKTLVMSGH
jgi:hypothetical protein